MEVNAARMKFLAMAASYCQGVFNDNYFKQAAMAGNRWVMRHLRLITLPDLRKNGRGGKDRIREALQETAVALAAGDNILLYPSGRLCRNAYEELSGSSGVENLIENVPGVRTVLIRTTGLWGSSFSWGRGTEPSLYKRSGRYVRYLIASVFFFGPRRTVTVELIENVALPKMRGRKRINNALEQFYNARMEKNTHIPYYWWQGRTPAVLPEPQRLRVESAIAHVPEPTRRLVRAKIAEMVEREVRGDERLANDLAMDSLSMMELAVWLEREFGSPIDDISALEAVNDCILAAAGQVLQGALVMCKPVSKRWFDSTEGRLSLGGDATLTGLFLTQAKRFPHRVILADQIAGEKTYRQVMTAVFVLRSLIAQQPGDCVGIMLPASVSTAVLYLATLVAGKTPVMINWTMGIGNLQHGLDFTGVAIVVTARALYTKLVGQGVDLEAVSTHWLFLDEVAPTIPLPRKINAAVQNRVCPGSLVGAQVPETATILFISGSELRPKAVPLAHANIIANLQDFAPVVSFTDDHRLLGMLPPFHFLGLVGTIILPLCLGLKTVYHPNPTESSILAGLIARYGVSIVIGTPTFLQGIIAAAGDQLRSLRLVFTGAEKCPDHLYQALKKCNPTAPLCEGYGIIECSPLVSINRVENPQPGTIGRILLSMEYAIIDPETNSWVSVGR